MFRRPKRNKIILKILPHNEAELSVDCENIIFNPVVWTTRPSYHGSTGVFGDRNLYGTKLNHDIFSVICYVGFRNLARTIKQYRENISAINQTEFHAIRSTWIPQKMNRALGELFIMASEHFDRLPGKRIEVIVTRAEENIAGITKSFTPAEPVTPQSAVSTEDHNQSLLNIIELPLASKPVARKKRSVASKVVVGAALLGGIVTVSYMASKRAQQTKLAPKRTTPPVLNSSLKAAV